MKISKEIPNEKEVVAHLDIAVLAKIGKGCNGEWELREISFVDIQDDKEIDISKFSNEEGKTVADIIQERLGEKVVEIAVGDK